MSGELDLMLLTIAGVRARKTSGNAYETNAKLFALIEARTKSMLRMTMLMRTKMKLTMDLDI